jgi:transposase-like protein
MTLSQLERRFGTEDACKDFLKQVRWPDGKVHCPRCKLSVKVYKTSQPFRWKCKHCNKNGYRFSVLTGTVFENTNVPLGTWFKVAYLMTQAKKGISALQIWSMIDPVRGKKGSYRTAWYMCHRIRAAMKDGTFRRLTGVVEVDETYIGGKNRFRHGGGPGLLARTGKRSIPRDDKVPVIGAIARKGNVVCQVIEQTDRETLGRFVRKTVSPKVSLVATDEHSGYQHSFEMPHETVTHSKGEYVRGIVHTQNLDSFWSLLKRGIVGNFHQVSKKYLPLYLNEFTFRHNQRENPDMFRAVIEGC